MDKYHLAVDMVVTQYDTQPSLRAVFVLSSDGLSTVLCSFCSFHDQLLSVPSRAVYPREIPLVGR